MPLGYLAALVATMPGWIAAMLEQDQLDVTAAGEHQRGTSRPTASCSSASTTPSARRARRSPPPPTST